MKQRTKFVAIVVLVFLMTGCGFIRKLRSRDELNKGVKAFSATRYEEAIKHFEKAVETDPDFIVAYSYMATAYSAMFVPGSMQPENIQNAERAIATFQKVLEKTPDNVDAIVNIAAIYYQLGNYDESRSWCRQILEKDPENAEALYRIGVIDFDIAKNATGMTGDLVKDMEEEEKTRVLGVVAEGVQVLDEAIQMKPDYFDAMHYLNLLYREEAKFAEEKSEKNKILLKADALALKALELERKFKQEQKATRVIKTKKEGS